MLSDPSTLGALGVPTKARLESRFWNTKVKTPFNLRVVVVCFFFRPICENDFAVEYWAKISSDVSDPLLLPGTGAQWQYVTLAMPLSYHSLSYQD